MQTLPVVDKRLEEVSITDLNRMARQTLKTKLDDGQVLVLHVTLQEARRAKKRVKVGVIMSLDTYDALTHQLHANVLRRKQLPPLPNAAKERVKELFPAEPLPPAESPEEALPWS